MSVLALEVSPSKFKPQLFSWLCAWIGYFSELGTRAFPPKNASKLHFDSETSICFRVTILKNCHEPSSGTFLKYIENSFLNKSPAFCTFYFTILLFIKKHAVSICYEIWIHTLLFLCKKVICYIVIQFFIGASSDRIY